MKTEAIKNLSEKVRRSMSSILKSDFVYGLAVGAGMLAVMIIIGEFMERQILFSNMINATATEPAPPVHGVRVIGSGPQGGVFITVAQAMQTNEKLSRVHGFSPRLALSEGSVENVKKVGSGDYDLAPVYAGNLYQAQHGELYGDPTVYHKAVAVAYLYGAPAQLVVRADSAIKTVQDLAGKRVAVGAPGSGAFDACKNFFTHVGLWDKLERSEIGYDAAAKAFKAKTLDAFWLFAGYPNAGITGVAKSENIRLLDVAAEAEKTDFFKKFPWYTKTTLPAETYNGMTTAVNTFQDATLLVANSDVSNIFIEDMLSALFSDSALSEMKSQVKALKALDTDIGRTNMDNLKMHLAAKLFWSVRE